MCDELNTIEKDCSVILNGSSYIVPSYTDIEEFGKVVLSKGILIADNIMETSPDDNTRLRAIGTVVSISKHISERLDAQNAAFDDMEDDLDEICTQA